MILELNFFNLIAKQRDYVLSMCYILYALRGGAELQGILNNAKKIPDQKSKVQSDPALNQRRSRKS